MDEPVITASEVVPRTLWHNALLWCGFLGSILFNVVYFTFGAMAVQYNMMRQPIGDLELIRFGWIQSANFIMLGLATGALAIAFRKELQGGFGKTLIPLFYGLTAVGAITMGLIVNEPMHTYISILTFVTLPISFLLFSGRFSGDPRWRGWAIYTNMATFLMLLFFLIFWFARINERPYAGIYERLIIVVRLLWIVVFVLKLFGGRKLAVGK
ncbi:MAG TPA: DUF998 domain-containing protein [Mucilaginibacter sp.]